MIRKLLLIIVVCIVSVGSAHAFIDKYTIKREELPEKAQQMLDEHFPKAKISMIKVDRHLLKKTDYDVKLTNGTFIEFNNSGQWTSIDCGKKSVPEAMLHKAIRNYVSKNYDGNKIVKFKKRNAGYDVGLSNGKSLRFNLLYQFKGEINDSEFESAEEETIIEE
ncbi:MAG: PepSY-like domain-containing protein [Muribaculaceae bacterium]|nr:PepSY-like domain-containing protein [Muribaculaceae bacterium]MDE5976700.1 PepSY-like domain-containing protein [Muribaculaceae bacterium]